MVILLTYLKSTFLTFVPFKSQSVVESDSEDDGDNFVRKTVHPSCPPESTLWKKRRRYIAWNSKPATMAADLLKSKAVAMKSREEFASLERDEERWAECFEISRHKLSTSLASCQEKNSRLRIEAKHLYELVLQECGPGLSVRKRRASQMREILEELDDRQMQLETNIEEYERVALSLSANGSKSDGDVAVESVEGNVNTNGIATAAGHSWPIVHMTIDELDYPEDAIIFSALSDGADDSKRKIALQDEGNENGNGSSNVKSSTVGRKESRTRNIKKLKSASNSDNNDKHDLHDHDDDEDSDGIAFDGNCRAGAGSVAEFCSMFAAVDSTVRLGEASLADLDPFFSDDENEIDGFNSNIVASGKGGLKSAISGSSGGGSAGNGRVLTTAAKIPTAGQKAATLKAASTWDSSFEYQKELKLAKPYIMPREKTKDSGGDVHWGQCVADATQCSDLVRIGALDRNNPVVPRTRLARGIGSCAVNLSAFAISRTPRGVPLIISPLSQYEDRFLGAVCGALTGTGSGVATGLNGNILIGFNSENGSSGSNNAGTPPLIPATPLVTTSAEPSPQASNKSLTEKKNNNNNSTINANSYRDETIRLERQDTVAVHVSVQLPACLIAAEDAVLERCRLQSLAAAAENKIRRLRASNIEWCRQSVETGQSLVRSKALFSQAHRDDINEYKIIRRELLTYGIVTAKDTDPPLSPVGEYPPLGSLHVVGKGRGGGPINRKGVRSIRGLNFAVANAALLSSSPIPPYGTPFGVAVMPVDATASIASMVSFTDVNVGIVDEEVFIDDTTSIADLEEDDIDNDFNNAASQDSLSGIKGKAGGGSVVVKPKGKGGKAFNKSKVDDDCERSDSPLPDDGEDPNTSESMSQGCSDSPMNSSGVKKRGSGGGKGPNAVGNAISSEIPVAVTAAAAVTAAVTVPKRRGAGTATVTRRR